MESIDRWLGAVRRVLRPGLFAPAPGPGETAASPLAGPVFLGNALYWTPETPFAYVYLSGPECVPRGRQQELVDRLYRAYVTPAVA